MIKRLIITLVLLGATIATWMLKTWNPEIQDIERLALSLSIVTISYIFFKLFLDSIVRRRVRGKKPRYTLRKTISLISLLVTLLLIARIWVTDTAALVAVYGFVAAAIAFALQDFFKNFVGGIILLVKQPYKVGDRVLLNDVRGDVIDIDLFYTHLLEIQNWVEGDQTTGRIATIPNGVILSKNIHNYTGDHSFIWDEIHIPVTYESNWEAAKAIILEVMNTSTANIHDEARGEIDMLSEKYFLNIANVTPSVYVNLTDNWVSLYGRYIVKARERRVIRSAIMEDILKKFHEHQEITIASSTMTITTVAG